MESECSFLKDIDHPIGYCFLSALGFAADSSRLVRRCAKPDADEIRKTFTASAVGFLLMGFVGYFVKLVFIPINNIVVAAA